MVFGGGGQVGCHLIEMASATGHDLVGLTHEEVDICDAGAVAAAIAGHSPTCIVNAAAYTAVDKAESDAMRSFAVNRDGASVVAEAAAILRTAWVYGPVRNEFRQDHAQAWRHLSRRLHRRRAAVADRGVLEEHLLRAVSRSGRPRGAPPILRWGQWSIASLAAAASW